MTTMFRTSEQCGVCGATYEFTTIGSTNRFGAPDLDTRPPEMQRSTMGLWVRHCPTCGYCADALAEATDTAKQVVKSEIYRARLNDVTLPERARHFMAWALVREADHDLTGVAWSALFAAWTCDDAKMLEAARHCRWRAVEWFDAARARGTRFNAEAGSEEAILADVYRRIGDFANAETQARAGLTKQPTDVIRRVLLFQIQLAQRQDSAGYTVKDAADA